MPLLAELAQQPLWSSLITKMRNICLSLEFWWETGVLWWRATEQRNDGPWGLKSCRTEFRIVFDVWWLAMGSTGNHSSMALAKRKWILWVSFVIFVIVEKDMTQKFFLVGCLLQASLWRTVRTNEGRVSVPLLVGNSMKGLLLGWLKIADKIPGEIPAQKRKEE